VLLPMRAEVLKGHLDGMLLAALEAGPRHGYAVREALRETTGGTVDLPTGTIYPALHRLERAGLITGEWAQGPRRRRIYRLTGRGRHALAEQRTGWAEFATAVSAALGERPWPATH